MQLTSHEPLNIAPYKASSHKSGVVQEFISYTLSFLNSFNEAKKDFSETGLERKACSCNAFGCKNCIFKLPKSLGLESALKKS